ncbi:BglG family transcriptional antiterminator [Neobacillus bataviensis]|uniref:BglG family transcriptional antiterminator n=1 Tax=Neobacillus bataviensis TaxID=220685 RepID=A0A561D7Y8_9BACI|nr:BglG family transcription antiterminator [Neobacillus bataviensis]TWD99442.1 BglG family transcriptional antiterminator [Neobacillus bataviensis]
MSDLMMDERVVQIIEIVRKKTYCSLEYLAETMGVSTRTVRNYSKQLNSDLEGIASFVNEKGKGYHLIIENEQLFENLLEKIHSEKNQQDSPQSRIAFIIDQLVNSDEINTLDEMAYRMNIGRTTLINELKKAAVALEAYHLSILGKQNSGMFLSGDELNLRFFILDNLYDYLYSGYPLDEDIKDEVIRIANQCDLESTTQNRLIRFVIIMLDRLLKDHPLPEINEKHHKLIDTKDYRLALEIADAIERHLPIKIPQPEILFITLPIAGRRTPTNNRTMADVTVTDDVKNLLEKIMEAVGFEKGIFLENKEFFEDLQYHLTFMLNRLMFGMRITNPLLIDVKEKYPIAYKMAEMAGKVIEREYGLKVSEDELGYIAFYFGVFIAQNDVKVKRLRQVAVICGTGRGTAKLVAIQLQRVLNQNTQIYLFSESEVTKEQLADYDMVFSTVQLTFETDAPLISINEIFDEKSISQQIERVTYLQKFKLKDTGNNHSIVKMLTNEDKFFVLDSQKGYRENVNLMIEDLVMKGYLDEGFKERLKVRAEKGSMVFDRYIALPHTVNHNSNKIELALGVFPEMVMADGKEIKLVFLLGIPEQTDYDASLLVKIYDEIMRIAGNQQLVNQLSETNSYEELSHYLEKASRTS